MVKQLNLERTAVPARSSETLSFPSYVEIFFLQLSLHILSIAAPSMILNLIWNTTLWFQLDLNTLPASLLVGLASFWGSSVVGALMTLPLSTIGIILLIGWPRLFRMTGVGIRQYVPFAMSGIFFGIPLSPTFTRDVLLRLLNHG